MAKVRRPGWHAKLSSGAELSELLLGHLRSALSISRDVVGVVPAAAIIAVNPRDLREIRELDALELQLSRFLTWSAVMHGAAGVEEIRVRIVPKRAVRRRYPEIEILFAEE